MALTEDDKRWIEHTIEKAVDAKLRGIAKTAKRPSSNVRLYQTTIDQMRVATAALSQTLGREFTYAELVEDALRMYNSQREDRES